MSPHFPVEVWLKVFSYLSSNEVRRYRSLNRIIYGLFLDNEFKTLKIAGDLWSTGASKICRARDPYIAKRVTALELDFMAGSLHLTRPPSWLRDAPATHAFSLIKNSFKQSIFRRSTPRRRQSEVLALLPTIIRSTPFLESFTVTTTHLSDETVLSYLWSILQPQTRILKVTLEADRLRTILPIFYGLTQLVHLSIHLSRGNGHIVDDNWVVEPSMELATHLNEAAKSIRYLSLSLDVPSSMVQHVFDTLGPFPRLTRAELSVPFDTATGHSIAHAFEGHPLEQLNLTLKLVIGRPIASLCVLNLPNLSHLELNLLQVTDLIPELFAGSLRLGALTFLHMDHNMLEDSQFLHVLGVFKQSGCIDLLEDLDTGVRSVTAATMDFLASTIPSLKILKLRTASIGDAHLGQEYGMHQFVKQMAIREYPQWLLRDITIDRRQHLFSDGAPSSIVAMRAVARSIPSIQRFDGQFISEIPSPLRLRSAFV